MSKPAPNPRQLADEVIHAISADIEDVLEEADRTHNFLNELQFEVEGKLIEVTSNPAAEEQVSAEAVASATELRWMLNRLRRRSM